MKHGALAVLSGLLLLTGVVAATARAETTIPEELLMQQMYRGETAQGRKGFKALVNQRLAAVDAAAQSPATSSAELARRADLLAFSVRAIRLWQNAEAALRVQGRATPDVVVREIVEALTRADDRAAEFERAAAGTTDEGADRHRARIKQTRETLAVVVLQSVAFTRETGMAGARGTLLGRAQRVMPAPATEAVFDAQHPSLAETFNIVLTPAPAAREAAPAAASTLPAPSAAAPEIRALVAAYADGLVRGDLAALKPLFVRGYWPKRTLRRLARRFAGSAVGELGPVATRPLAGDLVEVTVDDLVLVDAGARDRVTHRLRTRLNLRRVDGEYRIAALDPKGSTP